MALSDPVYVITGATGWLGRRVVRALTRGDPEMGVIGSGGRRVRALVLPGEDVSELAALGAEIVVGDLRDPAAARALVTGTTGGTLLHLAGIIHPRKSVGEFEAINVAGTINIVSAAAAVGLCKAIVMSSNSAIGVSRNPFEVFDEESRYRPYMGYGHSKRAMEEWLRNRMGQRGSPAITILRAPWFYGPGQPPRQTRFFSMIKAGRFPLMGTGQNRRSMGYVDSLAYGILLAADAPAAANRIYWLADERPYPMKEIVDTVREVLRDDFGIAVKPKTMHAVSIISDIARIADWTLQKAGLYNQEIHVLAEMNLTIACSIARAKRELNYRPLVDLREGMRRSVSWCLERGYSI